VELIESDYKRKMQVQDVNAHKKYMGIVRYVFFVRWIPTRQSKRKMCAYDRKRYCDDSCKAHILIGGKGECIRMICQRKGW